MLGRLVGRWVGVGWWMDVMWMVDGVVDCYGPVGTGRAFCTNGDHRSHVTNIWPSLTGSADRVISSRQYLLSVMLFLHASSCSYSRSCSFLISFVTDRTSFAPQASAGILCPPAITVALSAIADLQIGSADCAAAAAATAHNHFHQPALQLWQWRPPTPTVITSFFAS